MVHPLAQLLLALLPATQHQLEQLSDALGELVDLRARVRVEDRKARIDMPFVRVDAEHDVDFDGFDAADVVTVLPGVEAGACPCRAHPDSAESVTKTTQSLGMGGGGTYERKAACVTA